MKIKKEIIPAILQKDFLGIKNKNNILKKSLSVDERDIFVQVDICDGNLTPEKTFLSSGSKESFLKLKEVSKSFFLELDLIVDFEGKNNKLSRFLDGVILSGAKRVIFHNKGTKNWDKVFKILKEKKIEIGLGIWLSEKNSDVEKVLRKNKFNYIQIMGIENVGFGGQEISLKVFKKAKYFSEKFPELSIQVDGGVKVKNSKELFQNGTSRFVSGSGVFKSDDIKERLLEFKKEFKK